MSTAYVNQLHVDGDINSLFSSGLLSEKNKYLSALLIWVRFDERIKVLAHDSEIHLLNELLLFMLNEEVVDNNLYEYIIASLLNRDNIPIKQLADTIYILNNRRKIMLFIYGNDNQVKNIKLLNNKGIFLQVIAMNIGMYNIINSSTKNNDVYLAIEEVINLIKSDAENHIRTATQIIISHKFYISSKIIHSYISLMCKIFTKVKIEHNYILIIVLDELYRSFNFSTFNIDKVFYSNMKYLFKLNSASIDLANGLKYLLTHAKYTSIDKKLLLVLDTI